MSHKQLQNLHFPKTLNHPTHSNPQELSMADLIDMDVRPITTPHLDLDHLPLADKDSQINILLPKSLHSKYIAKVGTG